MARSILGSILNRGYRNELNRMLEELYSDLGTATETKTKLDNFLNGERVISNAMIDSGAVDHNKLSVSSLTINKAKDFPLKSVALETTQPAAIAQLTRAAILDAKVFGAVLGRYYRVTFIANGHIANGKERYGITLEERDIKTGERTRWIFTYNDDETPENSQNANVQKLSDNIDTIIVDNGEIAASITIDRKAISDSTSPTFLNLNSGAGVSPTAIIDPSNYSF